MTLLYDCTDRPDLQLEVNELSSVLSAPTEHDWRALIRLARYLITYPERGIVMCRPVHSEAVVIRLVGRSDTDLAQGSVTRRSGTCLHVLADGCWLSNVLHKLTNFVDRLRQAGRVELWSDTESVQIAVGKTILNRLRSAPLLKSVVD